jgi:hypothetical protein
MDKLKRDRRVLNYEQKILNCFYPNEFKVDNYEKGNEDYNYWHKKFLKETFKEHYEFLLLICFLNLYMNLNLIVERNPR